MWLFTVAFNAVKGLKLQSSVQLLTVATFQVPGRHTWPVAPVRTVRKGAMSFTAETLSDRAALCHHPISQVQS